MFAENLLEFFNPDIPGYAKLGIYASEKTVDGIFDNAYQDILGVQGTNPSFLCATIDSNTWLPNGTLVTIKNVNYKIVRHEQDESGDVTRNILERRNG